MRYDSSVAFLNYSLLVFDRVQQRINFKIEYKPRKDILTTDALSKVKSLLLISGAVKKGISF
jgi:hypothetical protein